MRLKIPQYGAEQFHWKGNHGFVDASELGISPGKTPTGANIYDDATDFGFDVKSPKTDCIITFYLIQEIYNDECELDGWLYTSSYAEFTIYIAND